MNGKQNIVLSLSSPLALITLCVRNVITKPSRPLLPQSCFCLNGSNCAPGFHIFNHRLHSLEGSGGTRGCRGGPPRVQCLGGLQLGHKRGRWGGCDPPPSSLLHASLLETRRGVGRSRQAAVRVPLTCAATAGRHAHSCLCRNGYASLTNFHYCRLPPLNFCAYFYPAEGYHPAL